MHIGNHLENDLKGIILNQNALHILEQMYLDTASGETCDSLFKRVARTLSDVEIPFNGVGFADYWNLRFYKSMQRLEFLPGSPILLNAGKRSGQLSSCHCLPVSHTEKDSIPYLELARRVQQRGSGTAFNFTSTPALKRSKSPDQRPLVVDLLHAYSREMGLIMQGGIRTGCNTGILSVHHPDIKEFIEAKNDPNVLNNFYLTVSLSDSFMSSLEHNGVYQLLDPVSGEAIEDIPAEPIFEAIVDASWRNGDPGVIFADTIARDNPVPELGQFGAVSGCGEQIMIEHESCFLGSINLAAMITQKQQNPASVDWEKLGDTVDTAVRFLDNTYEASTFASEKIARVSKLGRKIGLGVMGLGDAFYILQIPYNSEKAVEITRDIMAFIKNRAYSCSEALAKEKGACSVFLSASHAHSRRNATMTTIAPTGTISMIAGCSAGIEPIFRLIYLRRLASGKRLLEVNRNFIRKAFEAGLDIPCILAELTRGRRLDELTSIPQHIKQVFVTAQDVSPEWHLDIQRSAQKHTDNAVSKTVNLSCNATRMEIREIYLKAYQMGLKGITVYRDMSRENQPLSCQEDSSLLNMWLKANGY